MSRSTLPAIQAQRYDREDLGAVAVGLTHSAAKGPTYLRVGGRIAFVVVAVELFDALWPDTVPMRPRRCLSTCRTRTSHDKGSTRLVAGPVA